MRLRSDIVAVLLVAVLAGHCGQPMPGSLELSTRKSRVFDDGESTTVTIKATDAQGKVGSGEVTLATTKGLLDPTTVTLDEFGTATVTFSCDVLADTRCVGSARLIASWKGATGELPVQVTERCPRALRCPSGCADPLTDWRNCGACGNRCRSDQACITGACVPCPNGDCDQDGWTPATGDCCDQFDVCTSPAAVNPGAIEARGNALDDNCNGLLDDADTDDVSSCDQGLGSRPSSALDLARAIGLCRTTTEADRSWGVVSAEILRVNGDAGVSRNAVSIRPLFGVIPPVEGQRLAVLSTDVASDAVQMNPGLGDSIGDGREKSVNISDCSAPGCIKDWFNASRPPLKDTGRLPSSPACGMTSTASSNAVANDSVMFRMRVRAPTNATAFRMRSRFFSYEYPEFVCSPFNDQMVMLIDTPGANVGNPSDKNLMTYSNMGNSWPVGINLAAGTPLFQVCSSRSMAPQCWKDNVNSMSCSMGPGDLVNTQFAARGLDGGCIEGGGTRWMVTQGNVKPGSIFELRVAVWDVGDAILDSLVLMDDFRWAVDAGEPGTGEED